MYIDPHVHMVSRTTDDYQRMALAGCVAITEPAFWAGYDRSSPQGFFDYFRQLTDFEPKRAAQYGIRHHTWLCINPKEAEDPVFAKEVIKLIPQFLKCESVLGIGEIGLNKNSRNELEILDAHLTLAAEHNLLVLVHTPHLEDKLKGDDQSAIEAALNNLMNAAGELQQAASAAGAAGAGATGGATEGGAKKDDVIDAEYEVTDDGKKA